MNPIVQFLLTNVFNILEGLIQSEGPVVLAWLQNVLASFTHPIQPQAGAQLTLYSKPAAAAVNPFLQAFLSSLFETLSTLMSEGGPAALAWVEAELAALEQKYGPQPTPVPAPHPVSGSVHPTLAPE